jgi:hypothetical protein
VCPFRPLGGLFAAGPVHRGTEQVLDNSNDLGKFVIQTYDLELQQSIDTGKF